MGSDRRWFVDNGLTQGFLPCHVLTAFGDSSPERGSHRTSLRPEVKVANPPPPEVTQAEPQAEEVEMPAEASGSLGQDVAHPSCEDTSSTPVSSVLHHYPWSTRFGSIFHL